MTTQFLYFKTAGTVNETLYGHGETAEVVDKPQEVAQLVADGIAVELNADVYYEYNTKVNTVWTKAKAEIDSIQNSTDPLYDVPMKRQHDIEGIKIERDKEIRNLRREYREKKAELVDAAKKEQALAITPYSDADMKRAESIARRFVTSAYANYDGALARFDESVSYFNDGELTALNTFVPSIVDVFERKELTPAHANAKTAAFVRLIESANPVPIADALEKGLPASESVGDAAIRGKAIEQARDPQKIKATLQG